MRDDFMSIVLRTILAIIIGLYYRISARQLDVTFGILETRPGCRLMSCFVRSRLRVFAFRRLVRKVY